MKAVTPSDWADYQGTMLPATRQMVESAQEKYADFFVNLQTAVMFANFLVDDGQLLDPQQPQYTALPMLYARTCHILMGLNGALQVGSALEGATALRSLFETYVSVRYILVADSEFRSQLFAEFAKALQYYHLAQIEKLEVKLGRPLQDGPSVAERQRTRADWAAVSSHFPPPERPASTWWWYVFASSNPKALQRALRGKEHVNASILQACRSVDEVADDHTMEELYFRLYTAFSTIVHPTSLNLSAMKGSAGNPVLVLAYTPMLARIAALALSVGAWTITEVVSALGHPSARFATAVLSRWCDEAIERVRLLQEPRS